MMKLENKHIVHWHCNHHWADWYRQRHAPAEGIRLTSCFCVLTSMNSHSWTLFGKWNRKLLQRSSSLLPADESRPHCCPWNRPGSGNRFCSPDRMSRLRSSFCWQSTQFRRLPDLEHTVCHCHPAWYSCRQLVPLPEKRLNCQQLQIMNTHR